MISPRQDKSSPRPSVVFVLALLTACSEAGSDATEAHQSSAAALLEYSCASVPPDRVFEGAIEPAFVTPRVYDTCDQAYVVDINSIAAAYTGPGAGGCSDAMITTNYAGIPISQADCPRTMMATVLFEYVAGTTPPAGGTIGSTPPPLPGWWPIDLGWTTGRWLLGSCQLGTGVNGLGANGLVAGKSYRVATQALTPSGATRKVAIQTLKPTICR